MEINITVENGRATLQGSPVIVCSNSDYFVKFDFDDEWTGLDPKTARFRYMDHGVEQYTDVDFSGDSVEVPVLHDITAVQIGAFVPGKRATTPVEVRCLRSIIRKSSAPEQ